MAEPQQQQPPPQPQQGDETILEEAKNLLVQGRRFMALEDYQSATDSLEQSCQLFDAFYGVAKRECADAYLEYGLALVAMANLEAGSGTEKLMKKAGLEGVDDDGEEEDEEDDDDDDEEDDDDEDDDAEEEGEVKDKNGASNDKEAKNSEVEQEKEKTANGTEGQNGKADSSSSNGQVVSMDTSKEGEEAASSSGSKTAEQPQASSSSSSSGTTTQQTEPVAGTSSVGGGDDQDKDDDVDNEEATTIEIAWEVLCLAKRLYMTDESLEGRLKLAETLQKIGEISIEWDNNDNAVSILEECLKIRTAILKPDDRLIAVTYYHLGLAHSFKSDTQNANENFQNAINVIEKRIASLSEELEKAKANQDTVVIGTYQKEINELKELLPDMTMRLDDSKEDSVKSTEVMKRTREEMQLEDEEAKKVCLDKSKPVEDINHLVKRKAA